MRDYKRLRHTGKASALDDLNRLFHGFERTVAVTVADR